MTPEQIAAKLTAAQDERASAIANFVAMSMFPGGPEDADDIQRHAYRVVAFRAAQNAVRSILIEQEQSR